MQSLRSLYRTLWWTWYRRWIHAASPTVHDVTIDLVPDRGPNQAISATSNPPKQPDPILKGIANPPLGHRQEQVFVGRHARHDGVMSLTGFWLMRTARAGHCLPAPGFRQWSATIVRGTSLGQL